MTALRIRMATPGDAPRVAEIYNQGIEDRQATFETDPRAPAEMARRIAEDPARFPVLVAEREPAEVVGWASIGAYRARECYAGVGEFSIYVDRGARGAGVGTVLLERLIEEAEARGYWKLLSRIFPANAGSRALCRAQGFREVGVYERHARLDGQWLDVVIVERLIPRNQSPGTSGREVKER